MYKRKFFVVVKKQNLLELVADKVIDTLTTKKSGSKEKKPPGLVTDKVIDTVKTKKAESKKEKPPGLVADKVIDILTTKKAEKHWKNGNRIAGFCRVR